MTDWFRGVAITLRCDDARRRVLIIANNGRVPTIELAVDAIVSATVDAGRLELVGDFDDATKLALKLPPGDAQGIAAALRAQLPLPRTPAKVAVADFPQPERRLVVVEGPVFPFADAPVLADRIKLRDVTIGIEHNAPYRVTGFARQRPEIRVMAIEHMNPPVMWLGGETARVMYLPLRELVAIAPVGRNAFVEPAGTVVMYLPPETIAWSGSRRRRHSIVFEGDFSYRTSYQSRVRLAPISANDARKIFVLLDERYQVPKTPRAIAATEIAALTAPTLVQIDGTFQPGHNGDNFDGGIQLSPTAGFAAGMRYRVTGFLYPAMRERPELFHGYMGPRLYPLASQQL